MRILRRATVFGALAAMACSSAGCCLLYPRPKFTASLEQLVGEYNANARPVPRLWARATIELSLVTNKGAVRFGSVLAPPNGLLLLDKGKDRLGPHNFVLIGKEAGTRAEVFRLGNSLADGEYYYWYHYGEYGGGAYGRTELAGARAAGAISIDPLQLLSVLGICELPDDFTRLPTVVMRMDDSKACKRAYVLTYIDGRPGVVPVGLGREVYFHWDDKKPRRPFMIKFLDRSQRAVMTARVKSYRPIEMERPDNEPGAAPVMPTDIEITWPKTGSRLRIVLSEVSTGGVDGEVFKFWARLPAGLPRRAMGSVDDDIPKGGRRP